MMHIPDFKKSYQGLSNACCVCIYVQVCAHGDEDGRCHPSGLLSTSSETGPFIGLELTIRQRQGFLAGVSTSVTLRSKNSPPCMAFEVIAPRL